MDKIGHREILVYNILFWDEYSFSLNNSLIIRLNCQYWSNYNRYWVLNAHIKHPENLPFFTRSTIQSEVNGIQICQWSLLKLKQCRANYSDLHLNFVIFARPFICYKEAVILPKNNAFIPKLKSMFLVSLKNVLSGYGSFFHSRLTNIFYWVILWKTSFRHWGLQTQSFNKLNVELDPCLHLIFSSYRVAHLLFVLKSHLWC